MNRSLLWCFFTLFSAELFSSNSGLRAHIDALDVPYLYKKGIKDTLFFDGIDIYTELSKTEQQRFTELKKSRYDLTKAKIKTLRLMLTTSNYTEETKQENMKNNRIAINFLFNHCHDLEGLTINIVAALTGFDVTIDLDDSAVDIRSIVSKENKEAVFNGKYGDCIPNDFKRIV